MAKNRKKYLLGQDIATILDNANENITNIINGGKNGTDTFDLETTNLSTISDAASGEQETASAAQETASAAQNAASAAQKTANDAMPKAGGTFTGAITIQEPTKDTNPATKKYVDDAIKNVHPLAYVVSTNAANTPAGIVWYSGSTESTKITGALAASADTEYIIYLVPCKHTAAEELKGYDEYLTVKKDSAYSWEIIGNSVDIDLSNVGKVKDVKVNGTSVLGTDGVAAITIEDLAAGFVSVRMDDNVWATKTVNGTDYQAIKVEKTDTALGVFNSIGQEMVVQKVYDSEHGYLYLCVGTVKIACTIRKLSGGAVGTGGGGDVTLAGNNTFTGMNTFTGITGFSNTVTCGTIISSQGLTVQQHNPGHTNLSGFKYDSIIRTTDNASYTLTIPAKTGTLALTRDIPSANVTLSGSESTLSSLKIGNTTYKVVTLADIPTVTHSYLHHLYITGSDEGGVSFVIYALHINDSETYINTFDKLLSEVKVRKMMATGYCGTTDSLSTVYCLEPASNSNLIHIASFTSSQSTGYDIGPRAISSGLIFDTPFQI